jgi:pectinesterase
MDSHIIPAGWDNWRNIENEKTVFYAEYGSTGPGAVTQQRVAWSKQLTGDVLKEYTIPAILGDWTVADLHHRNTQN